jgi:hypothetical protein
MDAATHHAAVDAVTFSDLSRNPRAVAERARRLGRLRVTHRDADDFFLISVRQEEARDENLATASRMFSALIRHDSGVRAIQESLGEVFPWARHLTDTERTGFAVELVEALSDAADLSIDDNSREVIAGWRATARIKADKDGYAAALAPTTGDFGTVEVIP